MTTAIVPYQNNYGLLTIVDLYDIVIQAGEPFLPSNVWPAAQPALLVVSGVFSTPGVLSAAVTKNGVVRVMQLNSGISLRAGCLYSFSHVVDEGEEINYVYSADCTTDVFKVQAATPQQGSMSSTSAGSLSDVVVATMTLAVMMAFGMMLMKSIKT